jgi:septum formation protein
VLRGESPGAMVCRLAELKGRTLASRIAPESEDGALILAADTAVVLDDEVLGKPVDAGEAEEMLRRLRGRTHEVLTGVFLLRTDDGRSVCEIEATRVAFRAYDDATIRDYVAGGEPLDKAGAYGIQGRGALLTQGIDGSWSNVVGLPVERLPLWFDRIGIDIRTRIVWNV